MQSVKKRMLFLGGLLTLFGIIVLSKRTRRICSGHLVENPDQSMHEKLLDSKRSLEKTAIVIQSVLDEMDAGAREYTDGSND